MGPGPDAPLDRSCFRCFVLPALVDSVALVKASVVAVERCVSGKDGWRSCAGGLRWAIRVKGAAAARYPRCPKAWQGAELNSDRKSAVARLEKALRRGGLVIATGTPIDSPICTPAPEGMPWPCVPQIPPACHRPPVGVKAGPVLVSSCRRLLFNVPG